MRSLIQRSFTVVFFTAVWLILNEKVGPAEILSGFLFSALTMLFTDKLMHEGPYNKLYTIGPWTLLKYFFCLLVQIYKSGFFAVFKILRGKGSVDVGEFETTLRDETRICLLANAITLTPGTVTVDKQGGKLTVLHLESVDNAGAKTFERILGEGKR